MINHVNKKAVKHAKSKPRSLMNNHCNTNLSFDNTRSCKTVPPPHGIWIIEANYDIVFWQDKCKNKPEMHEAE